MADTLENKGQTRLAEILHCNRSHKQKDDIIKNSQPEEYEIVVLGGGAAGKLISWTPAKKGMRTTVLERKHIGGACPNIACLPSKNLIYSAKVASHFFRGGEFGIGKDHTRINIAVVGERKRKMVAGLIDLHLDQQALNPADDLYRSGGALQGAGWRLGNRWIGRFQ